MAGRVLFCVVTSAIQSVSKGGKYCDPSTAIPLSGNSTAKFPILFCWKVNISMLDNQVMNNNHIAFPKSSRIIELLRFSTRNLIICINSSAIVTENSVIFRGP